MFKTLLLTFGNAWKLRGSYRRIFGKRLMICFAQFRFKFPPKYALTCSSDLKRDTNFLNFSGVHWVLQLQIAYLTGTGQWRSYRIHLRKSLFALATLTY